MEHETAAGATDEWYTPGWVFHHLGEVFDLDPCHPGYGVEACPVRTGKIYTKADDGLTKAWKGFVFMNPPFGRRNGQVPWLKKFFEHRNGVAIVRAYTSAAWFHDWMHLSDMILFPRGKTKFVRPDGSLGRQPGSGVVMIGVGGRAVNALRESGLGIYCVPQYSETACSTAQREAK